ncbi:MAG: hypothetical protein AB7O57_17680, partial [Hyphomicrobiaceae bacterium]
MGRAASMLPVAAGSAAWHAETSSAPWQARGCGTPRTFADAAGRRKIQHAAKLACFAIRTAGRGQRDDDKAPEGIERPDD